MNMYDESIMIINLLIWFIIIVTIRRRIRDDTCIDIDMSAFIFCIS